MKIVRSLTDPPVEVAVVEAEAAAAEEAAERMGYKAEQGAAGLWAVAMATAVWVKTHPCLHPSLEEVKPHHGGREANLQVNGSTCPIST